MGTGKKTTDVGKIELFKSIPNPLCDKIKPNHALRWRLNSLDSLLFKKLESLSITALTFHPHQTPDFYPSHNTDHIRAVEHVIDSIFPQFVMSLDPDQVYWLLGAIEVHDIARVHKKLRKSELKKFNIPLSYYKHKNSHHAFIGAKRIKENPNNTFGMLLEKDRLVIARIIESHGWHPNDFKASFVDTSTERDDNDHPSLPGYSNEYFNTRGHISPQEVDPLCLLLRIGDIMDIRNDRAPETVSGFGSIPDDSVDHWEFLNKQLGVDYIPNEHILKVYIRKCEKEIMKKWDNKIRKIQAEFDLCHNLIPDLPGITAAKILVD